MATAVDKAPAAARDALVLGVPRAHGGRDAKPWRLRRLVLGGGFIVFLLGCWQLYSVASDQNRLLVSSPTEVAQSFWSIVSTSDFWTTHLAASAHGFIVGWLVAVAFGLVLGILMGWYAPIRDTLEPFIMALKSVPGIALIPLLIVWFGFGFEYKVAVVVLVSFFPLLVNTIAGLRNTDQQLLRMARSFGARDHQLLLTVALPGALPFIFTGLRQAMTNGVVGIVIAEFYVSSAGIGYLIQDASSRTQVERILALVVVVALAGTILNEVLLRLGKRFTKWQPGVTPMSSQSHVVTEALPDIGAAEATPDEILEAGGAVAGRRRFLPPRLRRPILGGSFILAFVGLWELLCRNGTIKPSFASAPSEIAPTLWGFVSDPEFWQTHMFATGQGFVVGWLLAVVIGLVLGFAMGWYGPVRDTFEPFIIAFYSTPRIALIPLFTIWFGFGFHFKVVIVLLAAVFPVLMNTMAGVENADPQLVRMARSYGASDRRLFFTVVLPGAVPYILTGLRLAVILGITGVVVGEIFSSTEGLGYIISRAGRLEHLDDLFAAVIILAVIGATLNEVLLRIERHFQRWKPENSHR